MCSSSLHSFSSESFSYLYIRRYFPSRPLSERETSKEQATGIPLLCLFTSPAGGAQDSRAALACTLDTCKTDINYHIQCMLFAQWSYLCTLLYVGRVEILGLDRTINASASVFLFLWFYPHENVGKIILYKVCVLLWFWMCICSFQFRHIMPWPHKKIQMSQDEN